MPLYGLDDVKRVVTALKAVAEAEAAARRAGQPLDGAVRAVPEPLVNRPKTLDVLEARLDMTRSDGLAFIYDVLLNFADLDFCETSGAADIYGVRARGIAWYIKIKLNPSGRLEIWAFHPPEAPLRTRGGETIR